MVRMGHLHQLNARRWMIDTVEVQRHDVETGWDTVSPSLPCNVQAPKSGFSSHDEELAGHEEKSTILVYCMNDADVRPGDRIVWDEQVWEVNSNVSRRSDEAYVKLTATMMQSGLPEQMIEFRRITVNADSEVTGTVVVGTFPVRFTTGLSIPSMGGVGADTARSGNVDGVMIGELDATVVRVGDRFVRNGMPGSVMHVDRSAPDHVEIRYQMETAAL